MRTLFSAAISAALLLGCDGAGVSQESASHEDEPVARVENEAYEEATAKAQPLYLAGDPGSRTHIAGSGLLCSGFLQRESGCTCSERRHGRLELSATDGYLFTLENRAQPRTAKSFVLVLKTSSENRAVLELFLLSTPGCTCDITTDPEIQRVREIVLERGERVVLHEIRTVLVWSDASRDAGSPGLLQADLSLIYMPAPQASDDPRQPTVPGSHGPLFVCPVDVGSLTS